MSEEYWKAVRRSQFSPAYFEVTEAMIGAFHAAGGFDAASSGMVNVEGKMANAVIAVFVEKGWLNEEGIRALEES